MNTVDRLNKEVELFVGFLEHKLKKTFTYKSLGDITDLDGNELWDVHFESDEIGIISNKDLTEFEVGHVVHYPGNYYEPDDSDYREVAKYPTIQEALWKVLELSLSWEYTNFLESQWAEECINEMEDWSLE